MKVKNLLPLTLTGFFVFLAGCSKPIVKESYVATNSGIPIPDKVLIYDFAVNSGDIKLNSSVIAKIQRNIQDNNQSEDEIQLSHEVADAMATELAQKIADLGLNPIRADKSLPVPPGSILITGSFTNIDEGNRLRRNVVGLGAGKSNLDTNVHVFAPSPSGDRELIAFDAHTDSGQMPGMAVTGPVGAAAGAGTAAAVAANVTLQGAKIYKSALAQQAAKLADEVAATLAKYFAQQGWIKSDVKK